jgi:hypothetical protein
VIMTYAKSCYDTFLATSSSPRNMTSNLPQSPQRQFNLKNNWPTIPNPDYSNHVRIHVAHNREHDCHDSSTLCRGCTHSPWVTIILGSQVPVGLMEYLYTLLGCALGYHYKTFQWLNLVCSAPAEVSPDVSVQNHQWPPLAPCGSQESPLLFPLIPIQTDP